MRETLEEIGAHELPELLVLNKIDVADSVAVRRLAALHPAAVAVSAARGTGLDELRDRIESMLTLPSVDFDILIPFERGDLVSLVHRVGEILSESHEESGTRIKGRMPQKYAGAVAGFGLG